MHCMALWCWSDAISAKTARLSFNPQQCQIYYYLLVAMGLAWRFRLGRYSGTAMAADGFFFFFGTTTNNHTSGSYVLTLRTFFDFLHCAVGCRDHISFLSGAPQERVGQVQSFKNNRWPLLALLFSNTFSYAKPGLLVLGGEPMILILSGSPQRCRFLCVSVLLVTLQSISQLTTVARLE